MADTTNHFKKGEFRVSVIMPVLNEKLTIRGIIRKVQKVDIKKSS